MAMTLRACRAPVHLCWAPERHCADIVRGKNVVSLRHDGRDREPLAAVPIMTVPQPLRLCRPEQLGLRMTARTRYKRRGRASHKSLSHSSNMGTFAETEHLNLRAYRDSDLPLLLALWNDPRVQRTGTNEYPRPRTAKWASDVLAPQVESALIAVILELREPCGDDSKTSESIPSRKSSYTSDDDRFVGYVLLQVDQGRSSNRDASLAIALAPRWWGRGYGTEAVRWTVDHAFYALGMHRISLAVMDGNEAAIALYKKMLVHPLYTL
jgi:RimJ/RimL family protein N-acetyltransferase